jgi:hypothetical protein
MICIPLHIDYYILLLDVTLIIRCMLWGIYHMLAEGHIVVHSVVRNNDEEDFLSSVLLASSRSSVAT